MGVILPLKTVMRKGSRLTHSWNLINISFPILWSLPYTLSTLKVSVKADGFLLPGLLTLYLRITYDSRSVLGCHQAGQRCWGVNTQLV